MHQRIELSPDLKRILGEGARLAHHEGVGEFKADHVRRAIDGEQASRDPSRDSQGLVQFSDEMRDALVAAQGRARARGARLVEAGDLIAVIG